jgi:hypothetical protein
VISFGVDDVVPASDALPTRALRTLWPEAMAIGGDPALPVLEPDGVHPLLSAVGRAFADHRPLVLSPDAVWLTIAQGVAPHVRLHAEELRPRLVGRAGRERLTVEIDRAMPDDAESWGGAGSGRGWTRSPDSAWNSGAGRWHRSWTSSSGPRRAAPTSPSGSGSTARSMPMAANGSPGGWRGSIRTCSVSVCWTSRTHCSTCPSASRGT